jgi:hypothetical protein
MNSYKSDADTVEFPAAPGPPDALSRVEDLDPFFPQNKVRCLVRFGKSDRRNNGGQYDPKPYLGGQGRNPQKGACPVLHSWIPNTATLQALIS